MLLRDPCLEQYTLESHFDQFRSLINVSQRVANFLSPFIFASLVFAVLSLCLTVYFVTHAKELINFRPEMDLSWRINTYFDFGWGALQVFLAIAYAISICKFGWTVNEEAGCFPFLVIFISSTDTALEDVAALLLYRKRLSIQSVFYF